MGRSLQGGVGALDGRKGACMEEWMLGIAADCIAAPSAFRTLLL